MWEGIQAPASHTFVGGAWRPYPSPETAKPLAAARLWGPWVVPYRRGLYGRRGLPGYCRWVRLQRRITLPAAGGGAPTREAPFARTQDIGYILARMRYEILLAPGAVRELGELPAYDRAAVRDGIERHLRHTPTKVSRSRIKRLRGLSRPQFRLRIDNTRVFYDITDQTVEILAIISKAQAQAWLAQHGQPDAGGAAGAGEG